VRCTGITKGGSRCKLAATRSSFCYQHSPETAAERSLRASRGGRAGGNGRASRSPVGSPIGSSAGPEIEDLKARILEAADAVLAGTLERGRAAVGVQAYNALRATLELERRWRELGEVEERLRVLEERLERPSAAPSSATRRVS